MVQDKFHALTDRMLTVLQKEQTVHLSQLGITLYQCNTCIDRVVYVKNPSVCFILQGEKHVYCWKNHIKYVDGQYLCYFVDMPLVGEVRASRKNPCLGIQMHLDASILLQLMPVIPNWQRKESGMEITVGTVDEDILDTLHRLINLACDKKDDIAVLAPLIKHELHYRLLKTSPGHILQRLLSLGSHEQRISQAISHLKQHFSEPLRIEDMAKNAHMSLSVFYRQFRKVTGLSPLQYQKSLKLIEARRLIRQQQLSVSEIALHVGYGNLSQFSREYRQYFGTSPSREKTAQT
ncbi:MULTISPECIES: AraC family transcriptional regulator [unclassified Desulfovibrio]|uniref:AraC family transcriptional regulator n=1 Tax=unclassified Desulfovibrio TaxID=2593640 RepID=UPI000F5EE682|nr:MULTISPECIES: AraC family transcriptional regulator [unclassified Desulfovibrio]RRD70019.1 AraC family transcriptional regulator [Desulfovibrio sp. OH1209_COT-279]RRD86577.1 AraC family transcriptional regulator [Desulfovibrio sp. OH1186_COT-070]